MALLWNNFIILLGMIIIITAIIFFIGDQMAFYADQLAKGAGISSGLIGFILIAAITSVPEMVSTFIASHQGFYGLVAGNIFGSNIVNIAMLSGIFLIFRDRKLEIKNSSIFSFLSSLLLLALVGVFIVTHPISNTIINKYYASIITFLIYIGIMYHSYFLNKPSAQEADNSKAIIPLNKTIVLFTLYSLAIVAISWILVVICKQMTIVPIPIYGDTLGEHFVGTLILAISTSIPELATTYQIVKRGQTNMAIENIAGSNVFNLMVLVAASLIATGSFWKDIPLNSLYTIFAIFMVSVLICIIGLVKKESKRFICFVHISIILIWFASLMLVF